ncbi:MAG: hypothetical protein PHN63_01975, partial [Candidatus Omnitrophica bacterium]|nr:hypothetical protein [Candidatus Omnitrophota bacterium]
MKTIILFIVICALILSCRPTAVMSEGTPVSAKNRKAVESERAAPVAAAPAPTPASTPAPAPVEAAAKLIRAAVA